jgi:hypothetical protein
MAISHGVKGNEADGAHVHMYIRLLFRRPEGNRLGTQFVRLHRGDTPNFCPARRESSRSEDIASSMGPNDTLELNIS